MNEELFNKLWKNGIIILDTCTLDFIERCEVTNAKKLMDIFLNCKEHVFVPSHVKNVEMWNYLNLAKTKKTMADKVLSLKNEIDEIAKKKGLVEKDKKRKVISKLQKFTNQLSKYDFQILSRKLKNIQKLSIDKIITYLVSEECSNLITEYDEFMDSGTVKSFYSMIMLNSLEQFSEEELNSIMVEGVERRKDNIPPACGDERKTENSFGDFIIWKEILRNILKTKSPQTLFITEDKKKGSNWFDTDGVNIHPILKNEVQEVCGYNALYISDLKNFVEYSKNFINEDIEELIIYVKKNSIEVIDTVGNYLINEQYDFLAERTWEAITQQCDVDYSLPDPCLDIEIVDFDYSINDKVEADIQLNVEYDTESTVRFGGDDWSDNSRVVATVIIKVFIDIEPGYYREDLYTLNLEDMSIEIVNIDIDAEAPFGMDESEEYYEYIEPYDFDEIEI